MGKLQKIAAEVGCSTSTISRVLNNYRNFSVSPELREKILDSVKRHEYRPNPILRAMRAKKTNLIAIFVPSREWGVVVRRAIRAFVSELRPRGYTEILRFADIRTSEPFRVELPVDAAFFGDVVDPGNYSWCEDNNVPYVSVNSLCGKGGASFLVDERKNMETAVSHLMAMGHSRIAYLNQRTWEGWSLHPSVKEREDAFLSVIDALELALLPGHDSKEPETGPFLEKALREYGATAILCYDHTRAVSIMRAARKSGIDIPSEVSLMCFNDEFPIGETFPSVTCVTTPAEELGMNAAKSIVETLDGDSVHSGESYRFPGSLITRESVQRP